MSKQIPYMVYQFSSRTMGMRQQVDSTRCRPETPRQGTGVVVYCGLDAGRGLV